MKKIFACAAGLALLAACADEASEDATAVVAAEPGVAAPDTMESYVGAWNVTYADGSTGVITNNADGSYSLERADGTSTLGLWSFGEEQSCWQADGSEEANCYSVGAAGVDGTRVLSMEDGTEITVTPATGE